MIRKLAVFALLLTFAGAASAVAPKDNGAYVGAGIGVSMFDDDGAFSGFQFDDSDTLIQLYGGYKFFKYFAVEGRYTDYGTFKVFGEGFDVTALSAHAVGIIPFGESGWELFGQLGFASVDLEVPFGGSETESAVSAGIGVRFNFSPNMGIAIQTDAHVWEDDSIGTSYDLSVGGTQVTFQYTF